MSAADDAKKYRQSPAGKAAQARYDAKRGKRTVRPAAPKRSAVEIKAEWNYMLDQAQANGWDRRRNCAGREAEFAMYDAADAPTPAGAEEMCAGCPLLELCGEYAAATKPGWGVWSGRVWRYGKIVRREEDMQDDEGNKVA